jgi:hypothetical protein
MIRSLKLWLACRRLNRLVAKRLAQFRAEHPDYAERRKAALRHTPRSWA